MSSRSHPKPKAIAIWSSSLLEAPSARLSLRVFTSFHFQWRPAEDPNTSPNVLQAKIDAQGVQHALGARLERYAIRLPKPESYVVTSTERSRVDSTYPPAASTENDYMTTVSLRYEVGALGELFLVGRPDEDSPFHPILAQPPVISFAVRPLFGMDGRMDCNIHLREAFHDLSKLVNLKLYVDFPEDPPECRALDPQKPPA